MKRAVFLDRDGVVMEEVGHLHKREDVRLLAGAAQAIRALRDQGFAIIVVTNQSAVARGLCSEDELAAIHAELREQLHREGAQLDDLLYCPHHPEEGVGQYRVDCSCRKPAPGMLLAAQERHGLDLGASFLVGDKGSDIEAAHRAGVRAALVLTGHGASEAGQASGLAAPEAVVDDLPAAQRWITEARGNAI
jgi:D-glycero-D-manno-heptose 1,7-bisphosphate phosphatase